MLVGLAAVIALILGLLALSGDGNDGELEAISAPEQTTTVTSTTTVATAPQGPATFIADATPLTDEFSPVEEGTYRVNTVGTPFSFTVGPEMFVQPNNLSLFVLTHQRSQGPDDRDIVFLRLSDLSDPAQPSFGLENLGTVWPEDFGEGWPADDFAGWLDNLTDEVVVSNREDTTLGGLSAIRVDLELGETDCRLGGGPCMLFGSNHLQNARFLNPGSKYRIWVFDDDSEDPMAVIVGINRESDSDWFDTADTVLSTLAFGDVAPNPIQQVTAGPIERPFLSGIRVELAGAIVTANREGKGSIGLEGWPGDTEFLTNPLDSDDNALETIDDLVAALERGNTAVTEIESTSIDGIETRVFDIAGSSSQASLKLAPDDERGWRAPPLGRVWLVDHPDRGLLMITSEAFTDVDTIFPVILAQTESIIESLEFIDLG